MGERTHHINIQYYVVRNWISTGGIKVEHEPAYDICSNFSSSHYKERRSNFLGISPWISTANWRAPGQMMTVWQVGQDEAEDGEATVLSHRSVLGLYYTMSGTISLTFIWARWFVVGWSLRIENSWGGPRWDPAPTGYECIQRQKMVPQAGPWRFLTTNGKYYVVVNWILLTTQLVWSMTYSGWLILAT